mmetsp:Transcript_3948/g.8660  ORF Transcript_3948/g.8660 Transcript_3948/m.8660 type:complete len:486 (-) Transcript_3948:1256-2713(-)
MKESSGGDGGRSFRVVESGTEDEETRQATTIRSETVAIHEHGFVKKQVEEYVGESVEKYVSLEIDDGLELFGIVSRYVAAIGTDVKRFGLYNVTFSGHEEEYDDCGDQCHDAMYGKQLHFGISAGACSVEHGGKRMAAVKNFVGNPCGGRWRPTMHFFVKKDDLVLLEESGEEVVVDFVEYFEGFLRAASKWASSKDARSDSFELFRFVLEGSGRWCSDGTRKGRPMDSIVMDNGVPEKLEADVSEFWSAETRQFYYKHGIPYRRSYLFYGPPGSGKSSMIKALATRYKKSVSVLAIAHPKMTDEKLADAVRKLKKDTILVLEDVDCLFAATAVSKEERAMERGVQLTFSGVLNVLDGLSAPWSTTLTIMTTNHIEKLNPVLVRAGRVDRKFHFPKPSTSQIEKFFLSFYPNASDAIASAFARKVDRFSKAQAELDSISMAVLQQMMIFFIKSSAQDVLDRCEEFFHEFYSAGDALVSQTNSIYT